MIQAASNLWDDRYMVLPCGGAIVKADAAPCRKCGREMACFRGPDGITKVQCGECCKRRPDDVYLGWLDRQRWRIVSQPERHR